MTGLAARVLAVHGALDAAGIPHAFGGAIALGFCVLDPRGTTDMDVNVFLPPDHAEEVVRALPAEITARPTDLAVLRRDGQVRLRWDNTPVDLFLIVHEFHRGVAKRVRTAPFEGVDIPVLDCVSLAVFKAFFNRPKDWIDIANMVKAGLDVPGAAHWLEELLGADHEVTQKMAGFAP
ncbi:MAG TPA: hypothetical protein VHF47_09545 [Acidimicrobiales bacterium]|nr:hypothetical protein [Acidimicrobiales bacterium]